MATIMLVGKIAGLNYFASGVSSSIFSKTDEALKMIQSGTKVSFHFLESKEQIGAH